MPDAGGRGSPRPAGALPRPAPSAPMMTFAGLLYIVLGIASFALVCFLAWMVVRQWRKPPGSPDGLRESPGDGHRPS